MKGQDFVISFFEGPPGSAVSSTVFSDIKQAGFNVAQCYANAGNHEHSKANICRLLDAAEDKTTGVPVIIMDDRLNLGSDETAIDHVVRDWGGRAGLYGYYVLTENGTDEIDPSDISNCKRVFKLLFNKDDKHPAIINLLPIWAGAVERKYVTYVEQFVSQVDPQLVCYDNYPLFASGIDMHRFIENLRVVADICDKYKKPFWNIILALQHDGYPVPFESLKKWQAMLSVAYGANGVVYFTYWQPRQGDELPSGDAIINQDGKKTWQYAEVQRINHELKAITDQLRNAEWRSVFHAGTGRPSSESDRWPSTGPCHVRITNDAPMAVGLFEGDGHGYLLFVNRDFEKPAVATAWLGLGDAGNMVYAYNTGTSPSATPPFPRQPPKTATASMPPVRAQRSSWPTT